MVLTETDITFLFILVEAGTNLDNNFMYVGDIFGDSLGHKGS